MARCLREFAEFSALKVVQLMLIAFEISPRFVERVAAEFLEECRSQLSATIASPATPAAGTTQTSERSYAAFTASFVFRSAVSSGRRRVEIGFRYPRTTISSPFVIPPSIPPARFEERSNRFVLPS